MKVFPDILLELRGWPVPRISPASAVFEADRLLIAG
jgi:hypothetical protein